MIKWNAMVQWNQWGVADCMCVRGLLVMFSRNLLLPRSYLGKRGRCRGVGYPRKQSRPCKPAREWALCKHGLCYLECIFFYCSSEKSGLVIKLHFFISDLQCVNFKVTLSIGYMILKSFMYKVIGEFEERSHLIEDWKVIFEQNHKGCTWFFDGRETERRKIF